MPRDITGVAALITLLLVGFAMLPDYAFFPVAGAGCLIAGLVLVGLHPILGAGLIVAGVAMGGLGIKCIRDWQRGEDEEADKARGEVQRRFGSIRKDE